MASAGSYSASAIGDGSALRAQLASERAAHRDPSQRKRGPGRGAELMSLRARRRALRAGTAGRGASGRGSRLPSSCRRVQLALTSSCGSRRLPSSARGDVSRVAELRWPSSTRADELDPLAELVGGHEGRRDSLELVPQLAVPVHRPLELLVQRQARSRPPPGVGPELISYRALTGADSDLPRRLARHMPGLFRRKSLTAADTFAHRCPTVDIREASDRIAAETALDRRTVESFLRAGKVLRANERAIRVAAKKLRINVDEWREVKP